MIQIGSKYPNPHKKPRQCQPYWTMQVSSYAYFMKGASDFYHKIGWVSPKNTSIIGGIRFSECAGQNLNYGVMVKVPGNMEFLFSLNWSFISSMS